ncbi:MAG: octaprenyl diphosphate synthase, partial [Alcaligenaceae bacterium]|nr:octaprenyl diphosphate synthase [Alcaligenaceae bacterium]
VMNQGTAEQAELIRNAIETGDADFKAVAEAIKSTDALQYTRQIAEKESELAIDALEAFPDSIYKQSLLQLARFAIERDN